MDTNNFPSTKDKSATTPQTEKSGGQLKVLHILILGVAGAIILLFVFLVGMSVGFKKASFSYRWGENYHRNFAGPRQGFFNDFMGKEFMDAHGLIGKIIKIEDSNLVIQDKDKVEKIVLIGKDTTIERFRDSIKVGELKVDDMIVVIGQPNQSGQVEAKFIRVLPPPPVSANFMPGRPFMRKRNF